MSYAIGIDLGTTFTAAAVADSGVAPQMMSLGSSGYSVPSVLFLREGGEFLAGEAAELRAAGDPTRVARNFKRRLGDDVPIRLAGTAFDALTLTRQLLDWVLELATSRRGESPAVVVLTHPANWGDYRVEMLRDAVDLDTATTILVSEPAAAAAHYVQGERVETGELIGVYDLGGGTFDAVVMRRTKDGFELQGRAGGIERLGGVDFDDAIWSYVLAEAEVELGADDDATLAAAYDLRSNCVAAKRLLSMDTSADIRVPLRAATSSVRLTRPEFERRIRPRLAETVEAFDNVLVGANVAASDLSRILLVGGSSRIPLVSEMLAAHFGVPIAIDSDPKNAVALGAAGFGAGSLTPVSVASSFRSHARSVSAAPETRRAFAPPPPPSAPEPTVLPAATVLPGPSASPPSVEQPQPTTRVGPTTPAEPAPAARVEPTTPAEPAPAARVEPPTPAPRPSADRLPPPADAPKPPARPHGGPAPSTRRPTTPSLGAEMPSPQPTLDRSPALGSEPVSASELSGVSTESRHRVRTAVPVENVAPMEFATVPAQAEPVGSSRTLVFAAIGIVLAAVVIGLVIMFNSG